MLYEAGPVKAGAMGGTVPLEWADLLAYNGFAQSIDEPWEARLLLDMSHAYSLGLHEGRSPFSIAPVDRGED